MRYIHNFLSKSAKILILCVVRRTWIKPQNNQKKSIRKLNSIFNDLFSLFLCPPNCLYTSNTRFNAVPYHCLMISSWSSIVYIPGVHNLFFPTRKWLKIATRTYPVTWVQNINACREIISYCLEAMSEEWPHM